MGTKYKDSTLKIIWWDSLVNKNKNNVSEKNTKEETDLNKENDNGSSSTQQNHDSVSSDATTNVLNKMDHNGEDGGADGKEGNESIKEDPWSNDYLDEFHQYLDYEEVSITLFIIQNFEIFIQYLNYIGIMIKYLYISYKISFIQFIYGT